MKALRGAWRFFAGDAPEMVPVVVLVVALAFALRHQAVGVGVLPAVVGVALAVSVIARARRHRRGPGAPERGARSVERQLPVRAAQAERLDQ